MASSSSLRRYCLPPLLIRSGSSTAQANLKKIITIISTVPPQSTLLLPTSPDVDLVLKLGPSQVMCGGPQQSPSEDVRKDAIPTANSGVVDPFDHTATGAEESTVGNASGKVTTEEHQVSTAESSTLEKSSVGECSPDVDRIQPKDAKEISEVTYTTSKADGFICEETQASAAEGYLGLLLKAARQVSAEYGDDVSAHQKISKPPRSLDALGEGSEMRNTSATPAAKSKRRRTSTPPVFDVHEETEPVVRSKRGRTQTLPSRFRDSVLEPWRKLPTILRR